MERILENEALLRQVADAIILLDDGRYAGYGVKIALVGVPSDIKLYFLRTDNLQSVSNRLTEIPEVSRLSPQQGADLVLRGFRLLKMRCEPQRFEHDFSRQVPWLADYIPQHIQELCLQIAFAAEDENNVIDPRIFRVGISRWVHGSLIHQYSVIESNMNSRKTKSGRRNQALYALGQNDNEEFEASEVEEAVRKEFPESTKDGVKLNLPQILNDFTGSNHPLLRRSPKKTTYRFCDPRLRIVIRCILEKDGIGGVKKLDVRKLPKILPTTMNAD
jgi:hypothetical protein